MDRPDRTEAERRLDRVLRAADAPGLLAALTERLSPTDLQTLLLETYRHRAAAVTPSRLLAAYEDNRFTTPSGVEPLDLARFEVACYERLAERGFVSLALAPVTPLGTNSAVAAVDQNNVVTTVRNTEVVSDATNVLALECALRRRDLLRAALRSRQPIQLAAMHRVLRAQVFEGRGTMAHFALLGLCTAGRDTGAFGFETSALAEQIGAHVDILELAREVGREVSDVRVAVTDLTGGRHRTALRERVLDQVAAEHPHVTVGFDDDRQHGVGYYVDACFEIHARMPDGEQISLVDGGLTRWTAALLDNAKERLAISGVGVERLLAEFRPDS